MGESCFIIPTCQRADGTHVESKLFEDLWKISGNYEWAETQYKIATDQEFLDTVSSDAVFDKNGQITAKSFMDITGITFASDEIKKRLSERWEDKSLPTEEVSDRVSEFNSSEELKDDFVPVVSEQDGEVVKFTISQRSPERVAALQSFIENSEMLKVVSNRLKDLGVAYDFVGERERYGGRFSTQNAEKALDGLYHLIEIADGGNVEETLLEESAHLATLACKDSTFINRLLNAINENTVGRLFTQAELEGVDLNSRNAKLELAGRLVAKAMKNEFTEYNGLLGNIKRMINRIFSKGNLSSLLTAKARAKLMAERLAHGFLYEDDMDVDVALQTKETLFSAKPITEEAKRLKDVLDHIKVLGSRVSTFSANAYKNVYAKLSERQVLGDDDYNTVSATEVVAHIGAAINTLLDRLDFLMSPLKNMTKEKFEQFTDIDNINRVYEADSIYYTLEEIMKICGELGVSAGSVEADTISTFSDIQDELREKLSSVKGSIDQYKIWFSAQLMREFVGKENITLAADVFSPSFFSAPRRRGERKYSVEGLVQYYYDELADNSGLITLIRSYSNHKDVTTQAFYNTVRMAKAQEAIEYNDRVTKLIELEKRWKAFKRAHRGISDISLYERLDDGSLTGYFIGPEKTGQFYRDRADVVDRVKGRFLGELKNGTITTAGGPIDLTLNEYKRLSKNQKYTLFNEYLEESDAYKTFMEEAYEDLAAKKLSKKYKNDAFEDLCTNFPEFKEIYDDIIAYKKGVDTGCLTDPTTSGVGGARHGVDMRIPQFKASLVARLLGKNRSLITDKDLYDSRNLEVICMDVGSDYFGSPLTEAVAFKDEDDGAIPDLRKLTLYGINLLEKPNDLTTNIFKALELYTEMASRFHTSQGVVSRLELFHSQLKNREVHSSVTKRKGGDIRATDVKAIATKKRENILRNFIYTKDTNWGLKILGILGAFGSIRALCLSPISGIKNFIAGYRVLTQDVAAGVLEGVRLRDVFRATLQNIAPRHLGGEVCRVIAGETMSFDHYQKLIDRWDSYRTPSKIHRKKGFQPLQMLINVAMANYSTTDNALVGVIYHSKMKQVKLHDIETGKTVAASNAYKWVNDNPQIRPGLLMHSEDADEYRKLQGALEGVNYIIENNSNVEKGTSNQIMSLLDPPAITAIGELEDFYSMSGKNMPEIRNANGTFKSAADVVEILKKAMRDLCFNEDEEFKICSGINDYIISSQGVYGMLNATEFQSNMYTQSLGKIKGYMFGIMQRNFLTNYRVSNGKVNHAIMDSVRLALWSVFAGAKEISAAGDMSPLQYRLCAATLCVLPIARFNTNFKNHMRACGWDDDQLAKLMCAAIGFWINLTLSILARALYRGNERKIGQKVYEKRGRMPLKEGGMPALFTTSRYSKLIAPGALFPEDARYPDTAKARKQYNEWKPKHLKNQNDPSEGAFIRGTKEYDDRVASFELKNIVYDTQDPMYYITGACYRLTRGIRDEGVTLMNPLRFANDVTDMLNIGNSIALSSGLSTLLGGVHAIFGNEDVRQAWKDREINFYLNKLGLTYDSKLEDLQLLDWYDKEEKIEQYQDQNRAIPMPWI